MKKQRVHVDAADDVIDFGFLFDSDNEQDLKEIPWEEYVNKAAAVNIVKSPSSTTHDHHYRVDAVEQHSNYGGTENFVEIDDDDDDHGINHVAKPSSTSTTAGQDRWHQIIINDDGEPEQILPSNYSDEQDSNEITNNAAVNVAKSSSSTTYHHHHHHHHHHQVDVVEEHSSCCGHGGTMNFVEIEDDDDGHEGINNVAKSSSASTTAGEDHGYDNVSKLSSSTATSHHMEDKKYQVDYGDISDAQSSSSTGAGENDHTILKSLFVSHEELEELEKILLAVNYSQLNLLSEEEIRSGIIMDVDDDHAKSTAGSHCPRRMWMAVE